uniref:Uncharacterized protein n=1 Tax=viral metagenome TaxID=1070528 RepID=A0A6C0EU74_9ZZZZ
MNSLMNLSVLTHCSFTRDYFKDLQKGEKYIILSYDNFDDHLLIFKDYPDLNKEKATFFNIRIKQIITLHICGDWEFLKIVKQKELIQNAMELRAINKILKRLIDDSFNYK